MSLSPSTPCCLRTRSLVCDSPCLTPKTMIVSPFLSINCLTKELAGSIFSLSVHQRNIVFGQGYPLPIIFTQYVREISGRRITASTGMPASFALRLIRAMFFSIIALTSGFSIRVSDEKTTTLRFNVSPLCFSSRRDRKTNCEVHVESFPPL